MDYIKKRYRFFFILLAFWFLLNLNFKIETIFFGIFISITVTIAAYPVLFDEHGFRYKGVYLHKMIVYIFFLFIEIFKSAFVYSINLMSKRYEPVVFKVELEIDDPIAVGIVANSITLTPGTITVDIVDHTIYVLTLAKPGTDHAVLAKPIKEKFENYLKEKGMK
jgi:multicomponent Na+:H+ antiporter subunit E